jgi:hypothetical protein
MGYKLKLGDKILLFTNECDQIVTVVDLTSDGVPFCIGDNFEGWIPIIKRVYNNGTTETKKTKA